MHSPDVLRPTETQITITCSVFFNDTATTEIYTLSLHDALPILIVGRDHAGVGSYYGPFDAQAIFESVPKGALKIEIFGADNTAWSKKLGRVVMMREAPGHSPEDFINLS